jgi:hypothetical protein
MFTRLLLEAKAVSLDLEVAEIPEALGDVERVEGAVNSEGLSVADPADVRVKVSPAAEMLGISEDTFYRLGGRVPVHGSETAPGQPPSPLQLATMPGFEPGENPYFS